jgi:hypothetical protein
MALHTATTLQRKAGKRDRLEESRKSWHGESLEYNQERLAKGNGCKASRKAGEG